MQFMMKWEVDFEIGGDKAPLICDMRIGAALDDQPTAAFLGSRDLPVRSIESGHTGAGYVGLLDGLHRKHKLF